MNNKIFNIKLTNNHSHSFPNLNEITKQSKPSFNNTIDPNTNPSNRTNNNFFSYSDSFLHPSLCDDFPGTPQEKSSLLEMITEWNKRLCISDLCKQWKKDRPLHDITSSLSILLFNVEGLSTHTADVDLLLNDNKPHICILTGVGAAARKLPEFLGYSGISQIGITNTPGTYTYWCRLRTTRIFTAFSSLQQMQKQTVLYPRRF
jgi:hypothetical protein